MGGMLCPPLSTGFNHVTCFGLWRVRRCNASSGLRGPLAWCLVFLFSAITIRSHQAVYWPRRRKRRGVGRTPGDYTALNPTAGWAPDPGSPAKVKGNISSKHPSMDHKLNKGLGLSHWVSGRLVTQHYCGNRWLFQEERLYIHTLNEPPDNPNVSGLLAKIWLSLSAAMSIVAFWSHVPFFLFFKPRMDIVIFSDAFFWGIL